LEAAKNTYQRRKLKRDCRAQMKGKRRVRKTFEKKEEEAEWMFPENFFERYLH